jgi:hypothetical protein
MNLLAVQIFIEAAILCTILYIVAKHEADYSFAKVAMVTAAIGVGSFMIESFLWERLGWYTVIPVFAFTAAMLMAFCWITLWKAVIVIIFFTGFHVLLNVGVAKIQYKIETAVQDSVLVTGPVDKSDYELAKEFHEQVGATLSGERPKPSQPTSSPPPEEGTEQKPDESEKKEDKRSLRDWALELQPEAPRAAQPEKKEPEPVSPSTGWQEAEKKLVVGGRVHAGDGSYLAYVNRKLVEKGNTVSIIHKNMLYRWRVKSISKDTVEFQPLDARPR